MKKIILSFLTLTVFNSPSAFSCNSSISSCNINSNAFEDILYYKCTDGSYINETGATKVARAVAENSINLQTYKRVFYRTCSSDKAMEIAVSEINNTLSYKAFDDILYYKCTDGSYINETGATKVAKAVMQNSIKLETYKRVFYRTCSSDKAMEIAVSEINNTLSYKAFDDILYYRCTNGSYINDTGATKVATAVMENNINLESYKRVFYRTCSSDKAMEIATGEMNNTLSFRAFDDILYYKCTDGSYINETGATKVAKAVAENRVNLEIYKRIFYRTCNTEKAMEISCQ